MFRLFILVLFGSALSISTADASEARPNILWIIAEDMGPELGCYGTPEVRTPVLDALAERSMLFRRAYTVTPVCSTSRSSFMTGMYAMSIDAHNHRSHRDGTNPLPDGVRVLTDWLRPAGYFTANVKELTTNKSQADFYKGTGKTDWNFTYPEDRKPFDSARFADLKTNQPFYAQINFSETHRGKGWDNSHEYIDEIADPAKVRIPSYYPDHPLTRAVWAQYHNSVMAVDKKVGFILDSLKRDGLDQNTIVVFMADHGRAMVRGKQWPYDSGLHIPLIIYWPENVASLPEPAGYQRGEQTDQLVASIDLSATTLDWAGMTKPEKMQGRVLFGENAEPARTHMFGGRDRGDETVFHARTVRTEQYRYIHNAYPEHPFLQLNRYKEYAYPTIWLIRYLDALGRLEGPAKALVADKRPVEELYDVRADPDEVNNLANDPRFASVKAELSTRLEEWQDAIKDHGRTPEPEEIPASWNELAAERKEGLPPRDMAWALSHPALGPYKVSADSLAATADDEIDHVFGAKLLLKRLEKAGLTDDQRRQFNGLSAVYRVDLTQLRREHGIAKEEIKKRDEVFRSLGKPKEDDAFWPILQREAGFSDRQTRGFRKTRELVNSFRASARRIK